MPPTQSEPPTGRLIVKFIREGAKPFGPRSVRNGVVAKAVAIALIRRVEFLQAGDALLVRRVEDAEGPS